MRQAGRQARSYGRRFRRLGIVRPPSIEFADLDTASLSESELMGQVAPTLGDSGFYFLNRLTNSRVVVREVRWRLAEQDFRAAVGEGWGWTWFAEVLLAGYGRVETWGGD
jgi:hypothetical protein